MCGSKEKLGRKMMSVLMAFEEDHIRLQYIVARCSVGAAEKKKFCHHLFFLCQKHYHKNGSHG